MKSNERNFATPTFERSVTSYPARWRFKPGAFDPSAPFVPGVKDAIDIHCHAHDGCQDPFGVAKLASLSGMRGLLYKTIVGRENPAKSARDLKAKLDDWAAAQSNVRPIEVWAGCHVAQGFQKPVDPARIRFLLDEGAAAVWMPSLNSANSLEVVGTRKMWLDKTADPEAITGPLSWEEAKKLGHYRLDDAGKLRPEYEEIIRVTIDHGAALFLGHVAHDELWAMAELVDKLGFKRAVVDHPFSPFVNLSIDDMKRAASAGLWLNFTFDELSPMLGADPAVMYQAIREVGPQHCTLSSDTGEAVFPNSVEAMRLMRGHMSGFGCSDDELATMCTTNPAFIVGTDMGAARVARAAE
ncbi:MAG: hypothetical protein EXR79_17360 [Myxococcales bacterium]|nr:hypothetical protein [Myxococcales bacterium]